MPAHRHEPLVLCYHAVSQTWPAELAVTPERFERQLQLLVARGYRAATFSSAVASSRRGLTMAVTFDDAYRSTLTVAKPILDRLGIVATVFVPTAYAGASGPMVWPGIDMWTGGPHEPELTPLSWPELRSLLDSGWEIGSHSVTHPHLTQLSDVQLAAELVQSRDRCTQELGAPCQSVAYPYGDVDARVVSAAATAGYQAGAALPARLHQPRQMEWPRIGIYSIDSAARFAVKVSPIVRTLRRAVGR